jgi:hypothetical protein
MVLGLVGVFALACAMAASSPAAARDKSRLKAQLKQETGHVPKEPFGNIPKGQLHIIISVDQQKLHLYSDGVHVADALIATGVPEHPTPLGVFSIVGKELYHESNIYSSAPMPYMQRITWSGVAIHQGVGVGRPASHGCIRIPREFAQRLWVLTRLGARVIIARPELKPEEFADPHLFAREVKLPASAATPAPDPIKTAQTTDDGKTTDAAAGAITSDPPDRVQTKDADESAAKDRAAVPAAMAILRPAIETAPANVPMPKPKPAAIASAGRKAPIAIFVSRKTGKIYVRQNFEPVFEAAVSIKQPDRPLGTHVFTAMQFLPDSAALRWTVVSLPGDPPKVALALEKKAESSGKGKRQAAPAVEPAPDPPPQRPQQALARIEIPQDVIEQISALIIPGSSLVVSDQGLGEETGEGTDFIVVTPFVAPAKPSQSQRIRSQLSRRAEHAGGGDHGARRSPHRSAAAAQR